MRPADPPSLRVDYASVEALATAVREQADAAGAAARTPVPADTRAAAVDAAMGRFAAAFRTRTALCAATATALSTAVSDVAQGLTATDAHLARGVNDAPG